MKIKINMLSTADTVKGQGVGSAYTEMLHLLQEGASHLFDITVNEPGDVDINHFHTVDPIHFFKLKALRGVNVMAVHFLPDTLEGSINLPFVAFSALKFYVIDLYKSADYLTVVNPIFKKDLIALGIDPDKIRYIPNYVSKAKFYAYDAAKRQEVRNRYGIKADDFVVIGVGQVQHRKGVLDFIDVAKKCPDIQFVWAGGFSFGIVTDGYFELKEIVENPPVNVKFIGIIPREQMNDIYNLSDVLFMPSYNELFPMSILEAANLNKPLVLRNLELYKDILFEKYLQGADNDEFATLLRQLKEDSELYAKAEEFSSVISTYYSKEHVLKQWIDFYTEIHHKATLQDEYIKVSPEDFTKVLEGRKRMLVLDGKTDVTMLMDPKVNVILSIRFERDFAIAITPTRIEHFDELDEESALELLLKNQDRLVLSAKDIYKYAKKSELYLLEFDVIKHLEQPNTIPN